MTDEDRTVLAGEYVLGTLPSADRRRVEMLRASDEQLNQEIEYWEQRLNVMGEYVPGQTPSAGLMTRIDQEIDQGGVLHSQRLPIAARSSFKGLRYAFYAAMLLAAGGVAGVLGDRQIQGKSGGEALIAVVNRNASEPALIVRVDLAKKLVSVRSVAADRPSGKDLQLWYIAPSDKPRSMGVLPANAFTRSSIPSGGVAEGALFAVSLEPQGGSPTGQPTGPVVYSGRLIREDPR